MKNGSKVISILTDTRLIALDSMCFIYFFEANPHYGPLVKSIFSSITSRKISAVTSVITMAEIMITSSDIQTDEDKAYFRQRLLTMRNLSFKNVDLSLASHAADLRSYYKLKLADAIQLATAITSGTQLFVTNDTVFRRVKELKVMILDDNI